ncbi:non-ribosomal peptide synthetase [Gordonia metallireducens]|uniref:hypothetical protein n=1 Tax=Gordonia metallireducens TaxID=2897779 RepID=UPI001E4896AA|nr:hypothetical protein [Gordonia metallireducens]
MNPASPVGNTPDVSARAPVDWLTADDDLFVKLDAILGLPVIMQTVWRFPGSVDVEAIASVAERMLAGRLSRLVARHRGPGRAYWRYTPEAGSVTVQAEPVVEGGAESWARAQAYIPLDVVNGPAWRFTVARTADGSAVLASLTIAHVIADGGSGTVAVIEAVHGVEFTPGVAPGIVHNVVDAADLLWKAGRTAYRVWREGTAPTMTPERITGEPAPDTDPSTAQATPNVTVLIPLADYSAAASSRGGTDNSLFAAIMVGILERCGRVSDGDVVPVSLPVSTREGNDRRANATSGARAFVGASPDRYDDLTDIRIACKEAYGRMSVTPGAVANRNVIVQALPNPIARRHAANATNPLCLASNFGPFPDDVVTLGTGVRSEIAVRAFTAADDLTRLKDTKGGVSGWLGINGDEVMLSVSSLDPVRLPDPEAVRTLVVDELAAWGLSGRDWGA